jgi:hypothetical protein
MKFSSTLAAAVFSLAACTLSHANDNSHGHSRDNGYSHGGGYAGGSSNGSGGNYGNGGNYGHGGGHGYHDDDDDRERHGSKAGHFAVLAGGNEVSDDGKANVGDKDGRGTATVMVDPRSGKLCFAIIVDDIDKPVAAHIHKAPPGQNGPVVVPLHHPKRGDPGTASDCIHNVDSKLLKAIREKPWAYYINVHTELYPGGAVRGQLF